MPAVNWKTLPRTDLPVPAGQYTVFIRGVDQKPSKTGKPMATLDLEILAPDTVQAPDGSQVKTAGRRFKHWIVYGDSARSYQQTNDMLGELPDDVVSEEVPNIVAGLLPGKAMSGVELDSEPSYEVNALKEPVLDSTGQPKIRGYNVRLKTVTLAVVPAVLGLAAPAA